MPGRKDVKTFIEVTEGKLLTLQDVTDFSSMPIQFTAISYSLNIPASLNIGPNYCLRHAPSVVECKLSSIFWIKIPEIKDQHIEELARNWMLPQLYITHAQEYKVYSNHSNYQRSVMMYVTAIELYKKLVDDLLSLFVVEDRQMVKYAMLTKLFTVCIRRMCKDLFYGLEYQIKQKTQEFGLTKVPQEMIDLWISLVSTAAALSAEGNYYRRAYALYKYNLFCQQLKEGKVKKHKYSPKHPGHDSYVQTNLIYIIISLLNNFLRERQLAVSPPIAPEERIDAQMAPLMLMFIRNMQKATNFVSSTCIRTANSSEQVLLLDELEGYQPQYIAPHGIKYNPIDKEIALKEKLLIQEIEHIDVNNINSLLRLSEDGLRLLSFIHMRYSVSLNDKNDYSYFGLSKTSAALDKDNYYKIFAFYVENIFNNTLMPVTTLVKSELGSYAKPQLASILQELESYALDIAKQTDAIAHRSTMLLRGIQKAAGIDESIAADVTEREDRLRHRHHYKMPNQ